MLQRLFVLAMTLAVSAFAQATLAPIGLQFFDNAGRTLSGGLIYTCTSGTTCPGTPKATYTDATGSVQAANPVVLDSAGRAATGGQNGIWLSTGLYKIVIKTSAGVLVRSYDGVGNGFTDPGGNGIVYRSALNASRVATLADLTALGVMAIHGSSAPPDTAVLSYDLASGLLKDSGITASGGIFGTGTFPTQFTFTEGCPTTGPASGKWTWCVDATTHSPKAIGNSSTFFVGVFSARGATGHTVLWDDTAGFKDGGAAASPYPSVTDGAAVTWDVGSVPAAKGRLQVSSTIATRALSMSNMLAGGVYELLVQQDATGGAALTGGTGCVWMVSSGGGGVKFPLATAANGVDLLHIAYDGTTCLVDRTTYAALGSGAGTAAGSGTGGTPGGGTGGGGTGGTPAATPTFSPTPGYYATAQTVSISSATPGATICYTTDKTAPSATTAGTCDHGLAYNATLNVAAGTVILALATKSGNSNSVIGSAAYAIGSTYADLTLVQPDFILSPATQGIGYSYSLQAFGGSGSYTFAAVGLPSGLSLNTSTGAITGTTSVTSQAYPTQVAVKDGTGNRRSFSTQFNVLCNGTNCGSGSIVPDPIISPAVINSYLGLEAYIRESQAGATVCYTVDGSTPTAVTAGTCATGTPMTAPGTTPISVGLATLTIKAIATKAGMTNSGVTTMTYTTP